jgi:ubiquinone/menaquinone biosynthesis C-methylase UbiE
VRWDTLYAGRKLAEGYPDLERRGVEWHTEGHDPQPESTPAIVQCLERLIDLSTGSRAMLVVGCGPRPHAIRELDAMGYAVVGVEPVAGLCEAARAFLGGPDRVLRGSAERLPVPSGSQRVVVMTSVLEHVDSPPQTLAESYRVLQPGGVLFVYTTNRWKFSWRGFNGEYRVPFFNWFPAVVKESYVFHHLHYDPTLANYNPRPAFHWFTYPELCALGRGAGFGHFYSMLDLIDPASPLIARRPLRRFLLNRVRFHPWLRGLALTQAGGSIFMVKRPDEPSGGAPAGAAATGVG